MFLLLATLIFRCVFRSNLQLNYVVNYPKIIVIIFKEFIFAYRSIFSIYSFIKHFLSIEINEVGCPNIINA